VSLPGDAFLFGQISSLTLGVSADVIVSCLHTWNSVHKDTGVRNNSNDGTASFSPVWLGFKWNSSIVIEYSCAFSAFSMPLERQLPVSFGDKFNGQTDWGQIASFKHNKCCAASDRIQMNVYIKANDMLQYKSTVLKALLSLEATQSRR